MTTEERNVEGSNDRTAKKVKRSEMSVEDRENEKKKTLAMVKTLRSSQPTEENEKSNICCHEGSTSLPPIVTTEELKVLHWRPSFLNHIRIWNNSFAIASLSLKEVDPPSDGNSYSGNIRIQGQVYHTMGNLEVVKVLLRLFYKFIIWIPMQ
ncbi:unnamed protein product [Lepeophtheirus salmonis]|uniref:(salmon louse) hypothetical protein n=1 Tax=Lepeophtheirus salmonis TaxID=72036 RepID=A0A7R8CH07_LEPSM|nr:unnamed protein product [Lepeophtheirus salmonis]CAF2816239.1 unnamed protein product [Lepeophtheirus salmonis]